MYRIPTATPNKVYRLQKAFDMYIGIHCGILSDCKEAIREHCVHILGIYTCIPAVVLRPVSLNYLTLLVSAKDVYFHRFYSSW